jgi:hypothetical protein
MHKRKPFMHMYHSINYNKFDFVPPMSNDEEDGLTQTAVQGKHGITR